MALPGRPGPADFIRASTLEELRQTENKVVSLRGEGHRPLV